MHSMSNLDFGILYAYHFITGNVTVIDRSGQEELNDNS